jgi:hypothetical protein
VSPIRTLVALPADCYDLAVFEWSDAPATLAAVPRPKKSFKDFERTVAAVEVLPESIKFKSLGETLNDPVLRVRSFKRRPVNSLASAFFPALTKSNSDY